MSATAVVAAVFALGGGKVYYAAPLLMPLFAAGAVAAPIEWYPLHRAVYSGHDSYVYWGPPAGTPETVLCVGKFPPEYLCRVRSRSGRQAAKYRAGSRARRAWAWARARSSSEL